MIREAVTSDYEKIVKLLKRYDLEPMTVKEMFSGHGIVEETEDRSEIVGFMWALVSGSVAVIDYLVVEEAHRGKAPCGRSEIALALAAKMMADLIGSQVTKFVGVLDKSDYNTPMLRFYRDSLNMQERRPYAVVKGNPQEVLKCLEACNG